MSDRKIYIGYVPEIHANPFNDIYVIPIFSGFRDKDTLKLVPVTPYQDIINDVKDSAEERLDLEAFTVALPIREIVYAHLHDFEHYEKFREIEDQFKENRNTLHQFKYSNYLDSYS